MTTTLAIVIAIWALVVIAFMALMAYRAHLTQYETDQLFLNETTPTPIHQEHDEIVHRLDAIRPLCKGFGGATIVMTILVIVVWASHVFSNANL